MVDDETSPYWGLVCYMDTTLPEEYPLAPPKIRFRSPGISYRVHPNFKPNGDVCLSLINTFSGEKWSPCNSLCTVFLSIRSRFGAGAIEHEPGFERLSKDSPEAVAFDAHVAWAVLQSKPALKDKEETGFRARVYPQLEARFWRDYYPRVTTKRGGFTTIILPSDDQSRASTAP
jgi:hypothetical protein